MEEIKMIGVIVDKHSIDDKGHYRFVYNGTEVRSTSNVLHVTSEKELSDEEIIKEVCWYNRISGNCKRIN